MVYMEWIVTTAPSVDEARILALDQLGVAAEDADVEVVAEPTRRLFGLRTTPAQVRARVKPVAPAPKQERDRRQRGKQGDQKGSRKRTSKSNGNQNKGGKPKGKSQSQSKNAKGQQARTKPPSGDSPQAANRADGGNTRTRTVSNKRSIPSSGTPTPKSTPSTEAPGTNAGRRTRKIQP